MITTKNDKNRPLNYNDVDINFKELREIIENIELIEDEMIDLDSIFLPNLINISNSLENTCLKSGQALQDLNSFSITRNNIELFSKTQSDNFYFDIESNLLNYSDLNALKNNLELGNNSLRDIFIGENELVLDSNSSNGDIFFEYSENQVVEEDIGDYNQYFTDWNTIDTYCEIQDNSCFKTQERTKFYTINKFLITQETEQREIEVDFTIEYTSWNTYNTICDFQTRVCTDYQERYKKFIVDGSFVTQVRETRQQTREYVIECRYDVPLTTNNPSRTAAFVVDNSSITMTWNGTEKYFKNNGVPNPFPVSPDTAVDGGDGYLYFTGDLKQTDDAGSLGTFYYYELCRALKNP